MKNSLDIFKNIDDLKLTTEEVKALLPNMTFEKTGTYLAYLGINKLDQSAYSLNIYKFIKGLINTTLHEIDFDDKVDFTFSMYDQNGDGVIDRLEIESLLEHFNDHNSLNFDDATVQAIVDVLMEKLDKQGTEKITKEQFRDFLQVYQKKPLTLNPFSRDKTFSKVVSDDLENSINTHLSKQNEVVAKPKGDCLAYWKLNFKNTFWFIFYITKHWTGCFILYIILYGAVSTYSFYTFIRWVDYGKWCFTTSIYV